MPMSQVKSAVLSSMASAWSRIGPGRASSQPDSRMPPSR